MANTAIYDKEKKTMTCQDCGKEVDVCRLHGDCVGYRYCCEEWTVLSAGSGGYIRTVRIANASHPLCRRGSRYEDRGYVGP